MKKILKKNVSRAGAATLKTWAASAEKKGRNTSPDLHIYYSYQKTVHALMSNPLG